MSDFIFILGINLLDFWILHRYLKCLSANRKNKRFSQCILFVLCVLGLSVVNIYNNPYINFLTCFCLVFIYSFIFKFSYLYHIIVPMLYIGLGFVTEVVGLLIIRGLGNYFSSCYVYNVAVILSELIRILLVHTVCKGWKIQLQPLTPRLNILLLLIPISSIVAAYVAIYAAWIYNTPVGNRLSLIIIIIIIMSNSMTFSILQGLGKLVSENKRSALLLREADAKEEYYREVERNDRKIQKIKHDLKNRLLAISIMKGNKGLFVAEVKTILGELEQNNNIYTTNVIFNTILCSKLCNAKESKNIKSKVSVYIPKKINIDYGDAGILLGNLLDNAIEACEKVSINQRWVEVVISYRNNIIILKISNSKDEKQVNIEKSSKKNRNLHGYGIESVKKIVETYNGIIEFADKGKWFEVNIILYGIQKK